jgi:dienelactone hydrolase
MDAFILLPRNVPPPYQTVLYFPGSGAQHLRTTEVLCDLPRFEALVSAGRVLVYPIYEGTYDRAPSGNAPRTRFELVEWRVHLVQDVSRTIDYLETRKDLISGKLAFAGFSWGGWMGVLASAIDSRIKVNVLAAGGFYTGAPPEQEADPFNYAPRVKVPTLMLNGRDDYIFPVETSQKPMFQAIGTAPEHKRHVLFDSGHALPLHQTHAEIAEWLDRYLGPVK